MQDSSEKPILTYATYVTVVTGEHLRKHPTCLYQRGGNQGPEGILGAEMVLTASSALSVLDERCKFEHVAGIPADPEANPPDKRTRYLVI